MAEGYNFFEGSQNDINRRLLRKIVKLENGGSGGGVSPADVEQVISAYFDEHLESAISDYLDEHLEERIEGLLVTRTVTLTVTEFSEPKSDVTITIGDKSYVTDSEGKCTISGMLDGEYEVTVDWFLPVTIVVSESNTSFNFDYGELPTG